MLPESLFDTQTTWLTDPIEAFAGLVLAPDFAKNKRGEPLALRRSSVVVYRARWRKFVTGCLTCSGKTLVGLTSGDIQHFLSPMPPASRHRYVRLLERVFDHLGALGLVEDNPARILAMKAPTRSNQGHLSTSVLSLPLQQAFLAALPEPTNWKRFRDRALIALILGGGLRVAEAIHLTIAQIGVLESDGTIPLEIYSQGASRRHRTRIQSFATAPVLAWLRQRETLISAGKLLPTRLAFPAKVIGDVLHPATVYRRVAAVLSDAGIPAEQIKRRGARTLRNTYAVRELAAGAPLALVGEALGHATDRATRHYLEIAKRKREPPREKE